MSKIQPNGQLIHIHPITKRETVLFFDLPFALLQFKKKELIGLYRKEDMKITYFKNPTSAIGDLRSKKSKSTIQHQLKLNI